MGGRGEDRGGWVKSLVALALVAACGSDGVVPPDATVSPDAAIAPAMLVASSSMIDFGTVSSGTVSPASIVTITNTGGRASGPIDVSLAGSPSLRVELSSCTQTVLAPHQTCDIVLDFAPLGGPLGADASLTIRGEPGGAVIVMLHGTGRAPHVIISPSSHSFGAVAVGEVAQLPTSFVVTNAGGAPSGALTTTRAGADPADFTITQDTCMGAVLQPAASCQVTVVFAPTSTGVKTAAIVVFAVSGGTVNAAVDGTATTALERLVMSPTLHDFGAVNFCSSPISTFTVTNQYIATSGTLHATLAGTNSTSYAIVADGCTGTTLAPLAACTVMVRFSPKTVGALVAELSVTGGPGESVTGALFGTGLSVGCLFVSDNPYAFPSTLVGATSAAHVFVVTNPAGSATGALAVALGGGSAGEFHLDADSCTGAVLQPAATCSFTASYRPTLSGLHTATLTVTATPGGTTESTVSGTGL